LKQPTPTAPEQVSAASTDLGKLPRLVAALRDQILDAAASGDIEALRPAIERNETIPIFGRGDDQPKTFSVAIDALKRRSFDGKGREVLVILQALLEQPYVTVTRGPTTTYIWPAYVYDHKLPDDPTARLALTRCLRFSHLTAEGDPFERIDRVGIGADGTWHFFWAG
jgi:hypothetical protein